MTVAERQKRRRERLKNPEPPPMPTTEELLAEARRTIRELEREVAHWRGEYDRVTRELHATFSPIRAENNQLRMAMKKMIEEMKEEQEK